MGGDADPRRQREHKERAKKRDGSRGKGHPEGFHHPLPLSNEDAKSLDELPAQFIVFVVLIHKIETHALEDFDAADPWLGAGYWLIARTHKCKRRRDYRKREARGKFGRFLVELFGHNDADGLVSLNQLMLDNGHAEPYLA